MTAPEPPDGIFSVRELRRAWYRVEESDGCAGIDGVTISRFASHLDAELARLSNDLTSDAYQPLPLLRFFVNKRNGEQRPLNVAAVRDRVAQNAVIAYIEPILEPEFENCSFGFRRGRSVRQALETIEFLRDSGYTWVVEADIDDYFDSVDHELLFGIIDKYIGPGRVTELIRQWMNARIYDGHKLWTSDMGLPQGQPVSPILANLFLDSFDEKMNLRGRKLVRYADDFVILCKSKPKAEAALRLTGDLMRDLKLSLNSDKTAVTNFSHGFSYLGATFLGEFCLVPPRKSRKEDSGVEMPNRLFASESYLHNPYHFNPAMADGLKDALAGSDIKGTFEIGTKPMETQLPESTGFAPPAIFSLCTLYIHEHGAVLKFENGRLEVVKADQELLSVPINKIEQIVLFGNSQITTAVMKNCLRRRIPILIFSGHSRFLGSIESPDAENPLIQRIQFEKLNDPDFVADIARRIVLGKIANCRSLLQRRAREVDMADLKSAISEMGNNLESLGNAVTLDEIRGYEGASAAAYFSGLAACFTEPFVFTTRTRRPPQDPINALLSFGYAMLFQNIYAIARARGLSTHVGMLHSIEQGHPALCSDLIEEFRAPIVDSLVTAVLNKRLFSEDDFFYEDHVPDDDEADPDTVDEVNVAAGGMIRSCLLKDDARRTFVREFERRINTAVTHQEAGIKTSWRGCIDLQIGHYIKVLRGEAPHYKPVEFR
jgi:CRISP-associated protein Cas1